MAIPPTDVFKDALVFQSLTAMRVISKRKKPRERGLCDNLGLWYSQPMDFMDAVGIFLSSAAFVVGLMLFGPKDHAGEDTPE